MRTLAFLLFGVALIFGFLTGCSRAQHRPEQGFWKWFQAHDDMLFNFEKDREKIFDQLAAQMHKLNPSLTFEFGPKENGHREFVISADGIREAFPEVEALYAAAPSLPRWKFTKFRARRKPLDISYEDVSVRAASVKVRIEPKGQIADLIVYIPEYKPGKSKAYTAIAFLFLDGALGEYDVETRVGEILVEAAQKNSERTYPLEDLGAAFDAVLAPQ